MRKDFQDQAEFLLVYVKEAHPEDEWISAGNTKQGILFKQPTTIEERLDIARAFIGKMDVETRTAAPAPIECPITEMRAPSTSWDTRR